jgi:hypothetical protein
VLRVKLNAGGPAFLTAKSAELLQLAISNPKKHLRVNQSDWEYELSLLPEELIDFGPWVASLVKAKESSSPELLAVPPHALGSWFGLDQDWAFIRAQVVDSRYAWTLGAWHASQEWHSISGGSQA